MADIHPIRLRGPWQYSVRSTHAASHGNSTSEPSPALPAAGKVQMPADWGNHLGSDFRGCVRYVRNFNSPTALEPHETVFLVLEGADALARVEINNEPLGQMTMATGPARFDITHRLLTRNELVVEVELPHYATPVEEALARGMRSSQPGGLFGEVRLEICSGS